MTWFFHLHGINLALADIYVNKYIDKYTDITLIRRLKPAPSPLGEGKPSPNREGFFCCYTAQYVVKSTIENL